MPRAERSDAPAAATPTEGRTSGRRKPPPPTIVLLVRHGTTATTGKELPGRAPGLHLSDQGREQAERVAARIAALAGLAAAGAPSANGQDATAAPAATGPPEAAPAGRRRRGRGRAVSPPVPTVTAVYASPLERTRETAAPIARLLGHEVLLDDGLLELDIGDWTGLELKAARKRPAWATIQRHPSGFAFPGGESFVAMQARIITALDRLRVAHPGETIVAVSHADPIRAAVNHAMGAHLDMFQRIVVSPCSLTAIAYGADAPTVLTVNDTGATGALVPS
jgi:broad specificity phosphatase PhoE